MPTSNPHSSHERVKNAPGELRRTPRQNRGCSGLKEEPQNSTTPRIRWYRTDPDWAGHSVHGRPDSLMDGYRSRALPSGRSGLGSQGCSPPGGSCPNDFRLPTAGQSGRLGAYFYVPGCRDQKFPALLFDAPADMPVTDWCSGPPPFVR